VRAIKVHELIERLQELDPNETVVLFLEEDRFDKEQPVYYVDDVWEAILFEHPELNRPYIKAIQDSGSLAIGVNGAKVVCALYPH
jgi:hypothetical protein